MRAGFVDDMTILIRSLSCYHHHQQHVYRRPLQEAYSPAEQGYSDGSEPDRVMQAECNQSDKRIMKKMRIDCNGSCERDNDSRGSYGSAIDREDEVV